MKYVALLRGINVGGNNIIKMADLRVCLERSGFLNVSTYIQSGNVIFESSEKSLEKLEKRLERVLSETFNYSSKVLVRSLPQMQTVLKEAPKDWQTRKDLRCYIAFIKKPTTADEVIKAVPAKEGIDFIKRGEGVVYMGTLLSGLTKSGVNKIISKKVYQDITIRNYNTAKKIATLMV